MLASSSSPSAPSLDRRSTSSSVSTAVGGEQQRQQQLNPDPYELRAALEEFFDRWSLFAAQESAVVPFDVQFENLVAAYSTDAIQRALLMTSVHDNNNNNDPFSPSYTGRLPIHLACDKAAPTPVIRWLIQADSSRQSIRTPDVWGDLPLHTACSRRHYTAVIGMLVQADPTTIYTTDLQGSLPLHMACRYNLPAVDIQLLLEHDTDRSTLTAVGMNGQTALHMAVRCDAPAGVVQVLLQHNNNMSRNDNDDTTTTTTASVGGVPVLLVQDAAQRIPLHVAFLRNAGLDVISLLLTHMLVGLMDRLGLAQCKAQWRRMAQLLLTSYERDFMTREKLTVTAAALQEMEHQVVLLELAVWRASCLRGWDKEEEEECAFDTMDAVQAHVQDAGVSWTEYKRERRIMCGAEEIVRSVMPFLEGLPLERYQQEFPERGTTTGSTTAAMFPRAPPATSTRQS